MFAVDAVRAYRLAGLEVPGLTVFFDALKSTRAKLRRGARAGEQPADDAVVQRLLAQWPSLPRNEFLAVGLGLACGLRPGEVAKATWDWLTVRNGVPWLFFEASDASGFKVKNRSGVISVRPLDPFWRILNERADREGWRGGAGVFLLDGSPSERKDYVSRRISVWLRSLGWRARFIQHALRAWSGGQVCLKWNLETARTWLRHENIKTTDEHYMYLLNEAERYGLSRTAAVEWAA
jgi:integrase